ncbi:MAG TPA: hypothetical protein VHC22_27935 [Pirellulales bacterium]|nr:hypothetical protein [Pirellulales bacterium]
MNDGRAHHLSQSDGLAQIAQARRSSRGGSVAIETPTAAAPGAEEAVSAVPAPFQFRLRTMLAWMAALSALFAFMQFIGAVWSAILVSFLLLGLAHVTANYWGTRVAPLANRRVAEEREPEQMAVRGQDVALTGAVRLSESLGPGWPMLAVTAAGAVIGGTLGSVALVLLSFDRAGYAGVVVGAISAAAVGGFLGFLTSSFLEIGLRAWKEAVSGVAEDRRLT